MSITLDMLGHIFKDNEGIYAYQYNVAIIGGVIQVSWLVFMRKIHTSLIIE